MGQLIQGNESSAPATPASGYSVVYVLTSDKNLYWKDDAGNARKVLYAGGALPTTITSTQIAYSDGTNLVGTSSLTWDGTSFIVGASKFTVAAASGNTAVAGTLGVTGATTLSDAVNVSGPAATQPHYRLAGWTLASYNSSELRIGQSLAATMWTSIGTYVLGAKITDVTSTGLAVTGTVSATEVFSLQQSTNSTPGSGTVYGYITRSGGGGGAYPWDSTGGGSVVIQASSSGTYGDIVFMTGNSPVVVAKFMKGAPANSLTLDSSGNLLVGTTSAGGRLTLKGSSTSSADKTLDMANSAGTSLGYIRNDGAWFTGTAGAGCPYNNTTGSAANVVVGASGDLQRSTSSKRYKDDIQPLSYTLDVLMKLKPVSFKSRAETDGKRRFGGLISEDVDELGMKEFVTYDAENKPDALQYGNMVALPLHYCQLLHAQIESLRQRLAALETK